MTSEELRAIINEAIGDSSRVNPLLAALEAAGVRLVPVGTPTQLIDGDERTTVRIFTPYAQT